MYYFCTQDIGVLSRGLANVNINIDPSVFVSGDKWMIATDPASKATCVFVDEEAQGILQEKAAVTDTPELAPVDPVAPIAPLEPAEPLPTPSPAA